MKCTASKSAYSAVGCFLFLLLMPCFSQAIEIEAITKPSADIDLSFVQPGKIHNLNIKEGKFVKKGDILVRQEDEVEKIQYQILTARAQDKTRIDKAEVELVQKEKDLQKMKWAKGKGAVTDWEVEHAQLDVETAMLVLKLAQIEHEQDVLKQREIKALLDRLHLESPINGIVEEVKLEEGESVKALSPVIRIVNIDPLLIDVAVPVSKVKETLSVNQKVTIKYTDGTISQGYIENISSVANAAANTLRVRVMAANPFNRPPGERIFVSFPDVKN